MIVSFILTLTLVKRHIRLSFDFWGGVNISSVANEQNYDSTVFSIDFDYHTIVSDPEPPEW